MGISDKVKKKKTKLLLVLLFICFGLIILFGDTLQNRTDTAYCTSCHMMKPEMYTWQASSHNHATDCVTCHAPPGVLKRIKYRLFSVKEIYAAVTGNYGILIQTTTPIPDSVCTQCHDMSRRQVTPSGDLVIPHDKHAQKNVTCTECHTGIAHGNIAEQRVTFQTDYGKWDESLGQRFMSDTKNIRPNMDTCMNCHKVRKASLKCGDCHKTSMIPESHKNEVFKEGGHGKEAANNLQTCDSCHSYMSTKTVEVTKDNSSKYLQFLTKDTGKPSTISVSDYAKANTYCKDCHSKMPPSHKDKSFEINHGAYSKDNKDRCFTCHDNHVTGDSSVTKVTCGSCHPSPHYKSPWREKHPVPLPDKPQVTEFCYSCHSTQTCGKCHTGAKK